MKAVRQTEREHINKSLTLAEQEQFVVLCEKLTKSLEDFRNKAGEQ
jgi:hypothetical protein